MRMFAQLVIAVLLATGVGFSRDRNDRRQRDARTSDRSYYRDSYRNNYRYNNSRSEYRSLPRGIQKKLRRGGSLPPGHARRLQRDRYWR